MMKERMGLFYIILLLGVIILMYYISGYRIENIMNNNSDRQLFFKNFDCQNNYEVIHIGLIHLKNNSMPTFYLYSMLKSLFIYRNNPLHLHILTDTVTEKHLRIMFDTWAVPQVTTNFYNMSYSTSSPLSVEENLRLMFPKIIPLNTTNKIILIDTNLTFAHDVYELWGLFRHFNTKQVVGLVENQRNKEGERNVATMPGIQKRFSVGVILYYLERLEVERWDDLCLETSETIGAQFEQTKPSSEDIINSIALNNVELVYNISCQWYAHLSKETDVDSCSNNNQIKIIKWRSQNQLLYPNSDGEFFKSLHISFLEYNGNFLRRELHGCATVSKTVTTNLPTENCSIFHESFLYNWRTIVFIRKFEYHATKDDITFVSQLTYDRLPVLEDISKRWDGPMSLTLYVTDSELLQFMKFIENSIVLRNRFNIAYHVVFKEEYYRHPINKCRNVALRNAATPYVFLVDIDFVPMEGLCSHLKTIIESTTNMEKKAFTVPAFETKPKFKKQLPKNKQEVLAMLKEKSLFQVMYRRAPKGHAATNYTKWKTAKVPYTVQWSPSYEPYIVVQKNVTLYDERFVGYGWDRIAHLMKLAAQDYEFVVLPQAFAVHKDHQNAIEKIYSKQKPTSQYKSCLVNLMKEVAEEINKKYGKNFTLE